LIFQTPQPLRTFHIRNIKTGVEKSFCLVLIEFSWQVRVITKYPPIQGSLDGVFSETIYSLEAGRQEWSKIIGNESGWRFT